MKKLEIPSTIHAKPSLYAYYFEAIKIIGLKYGFNFVLHGSMKRDLDLIAIPWEEEVGDIDTMIDEVAELIGGFIEMRGRSQENPEGFRSLPRPHNRITYIININRSFEYKYNGTAFDIKEYVDPQTYIDISVIRPIEK